MKKLLSFLLTVGFASQTVASDRKLSGSVKIDGSSTVYPIAEGIAEEFQIKHPRVRVTVGLSGTGGGFKKFVTGETDVSNASRHITDSESALAKKNQVPYYAFPIAFDGVSIVVHPSNTFIKELSLEQLKQLWRPGSTVKTWKDLNPAWPNRQIKLYGPGADSGTFDFFTEEIMGEARQSRADYVSSEDDNVVVRGISSDPDALGYFGYAYYEENKEKIKVLAIKKADKSITPSFETIKDSSYPLARPLLMYINTNSLKRPEMKAFAQFLKEQGSTLAKEVGYVPLPKTEYDKAYQELLKKSESPSASH